MTAEQVLGVLDQLAALGCDAWVDGGWGVDALLGRQTRPHGDLDLVIPAATLERVRTALEREGFAVLLDELPSSISFRHPDGREVDLHPVEPTPDGGGDQVQRDGSRWHYGAPTTGTIGGRDVRCLTAETQIRAHDGYELDEGDVADMRLLAERFALELPARFERQGKT